MITQIREACGAGRVRINGVCVARTTKRQVRRCARWSGGAWFGITETRTTSRKPRIESTTRWGHFLVDLRGWQAH